MRILSFGLIILFILGLGCQSKNEIITEAENDFNQSLFNDAVEKLKPILEKKQFTVDDTAALFLRSKCYKNLGILQGSLEDLNELIKLDSSKIDFIAYRADIFSELNKLNWAKKDLCKILKLDSTNYVTYNNLGLIYERLEKYDSSVLNYTKAIELYPFDARIYYNRAISLMYLDNPKKALEDLNAAIKLNPTDDDYYLEKGTCYYLLKDLDSSCLIWSQAFKLGSIDAKKNIEIYCSKSDSFEL